MSFGGVSSGVNAPVQRSTRSSDTQVLIRTLERLTGLRPGESRIGRLTAFAHARASAQEQSVQDYLRSLSRRTMADDRDEFIALATNRETSFFRGTRQLQLVGDHVLDPLLAVGAPGPVRIWSAACASGEEVLTLGMMVRELIDRPAERGPRPAFQLLGTDICRRAIETAQNGRYPMIAESRLGRSRAERFFDSDDGALVVRPDELPNISFAIHNLLDAPRFGQFDVVVLRNLFFYLSDSAAVRVIDNIEAALKPGGVLVLGANDGMVLGSRFEPIGAHCYRWSAR